MPYSIRFYFREYIARREFGVALIRICLKTGELIGRPYASMRGAYD